MTSTAERAGSGLDADGQRAPAPTLRLQDGVRLSGFAQGSGLREAPGQVTRPDGQVLQVTPVLYRLLEVVSDQPDATAEALAAGLAAKLGKDVPQEVLGELVRRLVPLGVLAGTEGSPAHTANPLLALRHKVVVSDPRRTARLASTLTFLFHPVVAVLGLVGFIAALWIALLVEGLAQASRQTIQSPGVLLGLFVFTVASAGLHELGHAAACKARGGRPGAMGAGLYLVWPAFYTDVNDSYRLDRRSRLVVDLGGLWVNAVLAAALVAAWAVSHWSPLLLGVVVQVVLMLRQLAPVIRADGYHILADLTGVPDLFAHIRPTLLGLLPWRWGRGSQLRPTARVVVSAWVLLVVPLLVLGAVGALLSLPRLAASTADSVGHRAAAVGVDASHGQWVSLAAHSLAITLLILPLAALTLMVAQVARRFASSLIRTGRQSRGRAAGNSLLAAAVVFALGWAWWPAGQWAPIRPDERGTLVSAVNQLPSVLARPGGLSDPPLLSPRYETAIALVPRNGGPALLLTRNAAGRSVATLAGGQAGAVVPGRVFPFQLPSRLHGLNTQQTIALGTQDGANVYDVAVAVVRVDGSSVAMPRNEAWALAACARCTTVAVSFQVVLVLGQGTGVVPIDAAVAANGNCLACATAALAVQLVASVPAQLDPAVQAQLNNALAGLTGLSGNGSDVRAVLAQVGAVRDQVTSILTAAGIPVQDTGAQSIATPAPTASADTTGGSAAPGSAGTPAPGSPAPSTSDGSLPATDTPASPSATPTAATEPPTAAPSAS